MHATIETIHQEFHSKLYHFILGRVSDPDTAEDILQDVYLKIHSNIDNLRDSDCLQSWFYQITCKPITDYFRRVRPQDELPESLASPPEEEPDALSELAASVKGMLKCLPDKYRQALEITEL
jgi:RNA polymerase sigma-70 factor (ECF subfamily)